ncbi:MAG: c-type cytochrome [Humidesulfovibrio sp.]|jgi:cytochrome c553|uniref:c-type cytochrome n=1 Tax=Humidesulfovibrio sp. TaxID=2910988 RepID=UPI002736193C|nr:c-type cytochrome [Humidesulfovibrio sp.]MDP2847493.1 c-type cytochrome [Humidesulfovibrio sp.]
MKRIASIPALALAMTLALAATALADDGQAVYAAKCQSCHGADGSKSLMSKPVKGLKAEALVAAMKGYKAKTYGGSKKATMENLAAQMSDEDIKAVAAYVGTL